MFIQADVNLGSIISGFYKLPLEELNTIIESAEYILEQRECPKLISKIEEMCRAGDYIPAVRHAKFELNCGLKVAKQYVDKIRESVKTEN